MTATSTDVKKMKELTPIFRLSYARLFEPQTNDQGKKVWSATAIFDKDADISKLTAMVNAAVTEKWGKSWKQIPGFKYPFRKGVEGVYDLDKNPEYKDKIIATFRSYDRAPGVVDRDRQPIIDQDALVSGDYCYAAVTVYAYEFKSELGASRGVSFGLSSIMLAKKGVALVSRSNPEQDFKEIKLDPDQNADQFEDDEKPEEQSDW